MREFIVFMASIFFAAIMLGSLHLCNASLPEKLIGFVMVFMLTHISFNQENIN